MTAGASAPEVLVERVVARIREWGGTAPVDVLGQPENVVFSLPRELRGAGAIGTSRIAAQLSPFGSTRITYDAAPASGADQLTAIT